MVFASNTSKYAVDPHLFKPEPPVEPRQVKELFHGREQELCRGVESLKAGLDIGGKRSKRLGKSPWVIHGESRSGKSHLARRIFAQFPDSDRRIQLRIPAGNRLDALLVLRELFEEMRQRFLTRVYDQRLAHDPLSHPEVQLVRQLVEKVGLFEPGAQTATLTVEQSSRESAGAGLEIGGGTLLAKFVAKF
ncbi:hypothetical protein FJY63_11575, partial [Candidatus Sumerlaeota bacterium]|nr:hypothetical protein [Candidatus Sumerlaeota bacterium]